MTGFITRLQQPDGSMSVTLTDGQGNVYLPGPGAAGTPLASFQQITVATSPSVSSLTVPTGALAVQINAAIGNTSTIFYRDDGTNPTATAVNAGVGMPIAAGTTFGYSGSLSAIKFTSFSGNPLLNVSYYK